MRTAGRCPPEIETSPTPGSCDNFGTSRVSMMSSTSVSFIDSEVDAQRQDRRVGRVDLGVDRRRGQIGGQKIAGGVDRRLHLLLGDVETDVEAELQGDDRGAGGALRHHLAQSSPSGRIAARAAPSPPKSSPPGSRRDRRSGPGSSDSRPRARPKRQEAKGHDADQQNRDHQKTGRDRAIDEDAGRVHAALALSGLARHLRRALRGA